MIVFPSDLPKDYFDFRSSSDVFKKYLSIKNINIIEKNNQFWWYKKLFWKYFYIVKFDRVWFIPDTQYIKKQLKHWIIIWNPSLDLDTTWWHKFIFKSYYYSWLNILNYEKYDICWSSRAKRAKQKFIKNVFLKIELVDNETFYKSFEETKTTIPYKKVFLSQHKNFCNLTKNIRNFVCYDEKNIVLWWLSVLDYDDVSSVHLVSFLSLEWKNLQVWTWLIDKWFSDSVKIWKKYLCFDHLKDKFMNKDQKWYSDFKENFISHKIDYSNSFFKIF